MYNKVVFMSFNKSKGLERKIVFVFSVDGYFDFINKSVDNLIPNILYVALTRSLEHLVIIQ